MKINIPASSSIFLLISYYFSDFQIFLSQSSSIIVSNYLFSTGFFQSNQTPTSDRNVTQQIYPYTNILVFSFARGTLVIIVPSAQCSNNCSLLYRNKSCTQLHTRTWNPGAALSLELLPAAECRST